MAETRKSQSNDFLLLVALGETNDIEKTFSSFIQYIMSLREFE